MQLDQEVWKRSQQGKHCTALERDELDWAVRRAHSLPSMQRRFCLTWQVSRIFFSSTSLNSLITSLKDTLLVVGLVVSSLASI